MSIENKSDDFTPDYTRNTGLNYVDTYRALAVVAGQSGDVDARQAYLDMAEMFQQQ